MLLTTARWSSGWSWLCLRYKPLSQKNNNCGYFHQLLVPGSAMGRKRGFKKNSTTCYRMTMRHDKCQGLAKIVYLVLWHVKAGWFCFLWVWNSIWSVCPFWVLQESVTVSLISRGWLPEITCVALQHWSCPSNPFPCSARLYRVLSVMAFQRRCSGSDTWTTANFTSLLSDHKASGVMGWT